MDIVGFPSQLLPSHLCWLPCSAILTMETRGRGRSGHTIYAECQSDTVEAKSRNGLIAAEQKKLKKQNCNLISHLAHFSRSGFYQIIIVIIIIPNP